MDGPLRRLAPTRPLAWQFLELQILMALGAFVCYVVLRLIPPSSRLGVVYHPGTPLYYVADILFLVGPVVAWRMYRGHGWRRSLELGAAMLAPVVVIIVVGQLAGYDYVPWLPFVGYPVLSLGLLAYLLYRREQRAPAPSALAG